MAWEYVIHTGDLNLFRSPISWMVCAKDVKRLAIDGTSQPWGV